jgi:hypothetical protein
MRTATLPVSKMFSFKFETCIGKVKIIYLLGSPILNTITNQDENIILIPMPVLTFRNRASYI